MNTEVRAQLAAQGQKLADDRITALVERGLDTLARAGLEMTVSANGTYISSVAGQKLRGSASLDGEVFVLTPENNAGIARYTLTGGRLVSQAPRDVHAQYLPMVLKRR